MVCVCDMQRFTRASTSTTLCRHTTIMTRRRVGTRPARRARATPSPSATTPNHSTGERPFPEAHGHGAMREYPLVAGGHQYHDGRRAARAPSCRRTSMAVSFLFFFVRAGGRCPDFIWQDIPSLVSPDMASQARIWRTTMSRVTSNTTTLDRHRGKVTQPYPIRYVDQVVVCRRSTCFVSTLNKPIK